MGKMKEKRREIGMKERREGNRQNMNRKEKAKTGMETGVSCLFVFADIQSTLLSVSMAKGIWSHSYPPAYRQPSFPKYTL